MKAARSLFVIAGSAVATVLLAGLYLVPRPVGAQAAPTLELTPRLPISLDGLSLSVEPEKAKWEIGEKPVFFLVAKNTSKDHREEQVSLSMHRTDIPSPLSRIAMISAPVAVLAREITIRLEPDGEKRIRVEPEGPITTASTVRLSVSAGGKTGDSEPLAFQADGWKFEVLEASEK